MMVSMLIQSTVLLVRELVVIEGVQRVIRLVLIVRRGNWTRLSTSLGMGIERVVRNRLLKIVAIADWEGI